MKRVICLILAVVVCVSLASCGGEAATPAGIVIPDIQNMDMDTAKTLLASKGLIPKVEYQYNNDFDYDMVIETNPAIGTEVTGDTPVTMYVCQGPVYYELPPSVAWFWNIEGIEDFSWGDDGKPQTKGFSSVRVEEGYLYISMWLKCTSVYELSFYENFGTAAINDTFDKTVPIEVIYDDVNVSNQGGTTEFEIKVPLSDLGVQKPTNLYTEFDFVVDGKRQTFKAKFALTW